MCRALKVVYGGLQHDLGAAVHRETEDAGADGREGECFDTIPVSQYERVERGVFELGVFIPFAHTRADGVDDILCLQITRGGLDRGSDTGRTNLVAFGLNGGAAFGADGTCYSTAENELCIGSIDNGLGIGLGDIPFDQFQSRVIDFDLYQKSLPANLPILGLNRHLIFFHIGADPFCVILVVLVEFLEQFQHF